MGLAAELVKWGWQRGSYATGGCFDHVQHIMFGGTALCEKMACRAAHVFMYANIPGNLPTVQ